MAFHAVPLLKISGARQHQPRPGATGHYLRVRYGCLSWLNKNWPTQSHPGNLLFLSIGAALKDSHLCWIKNKIAGKSVCLVFANNLTGHLSDVKIAAAIRQHPLELYAVPGAHVSTRFRKRSIQFPQDRFSLHTFEKAMACRFGVRTYKSKNHNTLFDELKAQAFTPI